MFLISLLARYRYDNFFNRLTAAGTLERSLFSRFRYSSISSSPRKASSSTFLIVFEDKWILLVSRPSKIPAVNDVNLLLSRLKSLIFKVRLVRLSVPIHSMQFSLTSTSSKFELWKSGSSRLLKSLPLRYNHVRCLKDFKEDGKDFKRLLLRLRVCILGGRLSSNSSSMLLLSRFNQARDSNVLNIFGISMIELSPKKAFVSASFECPQSPSSDVKWLLEIQLFCYNYTILWFDRLILLLN